MPGPVHAVSAAEAAQLAADQMSEATFQQQVEAVAKRLGWRCYHTKFSQGSSAGFPDLVMVRGLRLVFAELKRQSETRGKVTAKQQAWLDDLEAVAAGIDAVRSPDASPIPGVEVYVWRPIDITSTPNPIAIALR